MNEWETVPVGDDSKFTRKVDHIRKIWKTNPVWTIRKILLPILFGIGTLCSIVILILLVVYFPIAPIVPVTGDPNISATGSKKSLLITNNITPSKGLPLELVSKGHYYGFYNHYLNRVSKKTHIHQQGEVSPKVTSYFIRDSNGFNNLTDDGYKIETLKNGNYSTCFTCDPSGFVIDSAVMKNLLVTNTTTTYDLQAVNMVSAKYMNSMSDITTGGNIIVTSTPTDGGPVGGNIIVSNNIDASGRITGESLYATNNINAGGTISAAGTLSAYYITTPNTITAGGAIYGAYISNTFTVTSYDIAAVNRVSGSYGSFTGHVDTAVINSNGVFVSGYAGSGLAFGDGSQQNIYSAQGHTFISYAYGNPWVNDPRCSIKTRYGGVDVQNLVVYGTFSQPSDKRLKTNITDINEVKNEASFLRLQFKSFEMKNKIGIKKLGVIAQDAIKIVPELMGARLNMTENGSIVQRLSIQYSELFMMATIQTKYNTKRIKLLETENRILKKRLELIEIKLGLKK